MRPGQQNHQHHKRSRGRGRNKPQNLMHRSFESSGPDMKIRGTAQHIYEKYLERARDANSSGDRVAAENYLQHAEHYYRILMAAQAQAQQFQQQNGGGPNGNRPHQPGMEPQPSMDGQSDNQQGDDGDDQGDDGDDARM